MLFTSAAFAAFFAIVLLGLSVLRSQDHKILFLCAAGAFFYGYWDARFLALLGFTSIFDFLLGIAIARQANPKKKKALLALDIVVNLGILAWFKYLNFFLDSARALLAPLGLRVGTLSVILPIGISFFVFEAMSYCIDIYRGELAPYRRWTRFAAFLFFFPRMIAGPIIRASDFLPQLERPIQITRANLLRGGELFLLGITKKVIIADRVAPFVDLVFAHPQAYSPATAWQAVLGYAVQIYCDFSGYSDMAIGLSRIMGIELPENFCLPYLATSLTDFWRRWHISLSSWLRDYLYISLGGSRRGKARTHLNLLITMVLGGLWHGASWTFVVWGLLHGLGLAVDKQTRAFAAKRFASAPPWLGAATGWLLTQGFVGFAWIFFRAQTFGCATILIRKLTLLDTGGLFWIAEPLVAVSLLVAVAHAAAARLGTTAALTLAGGSFWRLSLLFTWVLGVFLLGASNPSPFIYFQF